MEKYIKGDLIELIVCTAFVSSITPMVFFEFPGFMNICMKKEHCLFNKLTAVGVKLTENPKFSLKYRTYAIVYFSTLITLGNT